MSKQAKKQYTLRNISERLDAQIQKIAQKKNTSINQLLLDIISKSISRLSNLNLEKKHDLDFLIGSWVEDDEFNRSILSQSKIDKDLWK